MINVKFLILGAGPAGLTFANVLKQNNINDFLVLERLREAGGLCRSEKLDSGAIDVGGGHFLDTRCPEVLDFIFKFRPRREWNKYSRDSQIFIHNTLIGHPFEANIWQLSSELQDMYLDSIKAAGCNNGEPMPSKFTDWIYWKLGKAVADNYMLPYNRKLYGELLDELGTYWLEKLPNVSYEETLKSCAEHRAYGTEPGHAEFYYPKWGGFGDVFLRMADEIKDNIVYAEYVRKLDVTERTVNDEYCGEYIINTIPLPSITSIQGITQEIVTAIQSLKSTGIYLGYSPDDIDTQAQWIYYPDESILHHRALVRKNFQPGVRGYWTETSAPRFFKYNREECIFYHNEYAYPLNTIGKNENMSMILQSLRANKIFGLGRWGEWQHYNTDVVIERAIKMAQKFLM
jgi:protoporphyrinogen oxidase